MLWLTAACEGLDDDHAATAAGTWTQQHAGFVDCCFGRLGFFQARRHREQLAGACDIGRAVAIGKQSVVADAVEAVRQDVDEKAADELVRAERDDFVSRAAIGAIILVPEGDAVVVGGDQPAVGDGDAVGIAREISEHRLGSTERRLCVEVPLDLAQRRQIRLERSGVIEVGVDAKKLEVTGLVGGAELGQEQSPEQA